MSGTAKFAVWLLGLTLVGGCVHPHRPLVVTDPDPSIKIPATELAVQRHDLSAVPQLINDLESDDPAVRLYASHALEQLTKQTMGYRYYDDEDNREAAVERWRRWYGEQAKPTTAGAMQKP